MDLEATQTISSRGTTTHASTKESNIAPSYCDPAQVMPVVFELTGREVPSVVEKFCPFYTVDPCHSIMKSYFQWQKKKKKKMALGDPRY